MRLTLCWFGMELDLYLGETRVDDVDEPVFEAGSPRGDALSVPVGFTRPEIPWDADGPVHQYDPSEADEDHRS